MPDTVPMSQWLRPTDVAVKLDVSLRTAYRLIESGELRSTKVGGSYRVHPDAISRYFNDAREAA